MSERSEYTAGLRALADLLDASPLVPLPLHGAKGGLLMYIYCESRDAFAAFAQAMPGTLHKTVRSQRSYGFELAGHLRGLSIGAAVRQDQVRDRVVIGRRRLTRQAPDPYTSAANVTETVENVEGVCRPVLADMP